MHPLTLVSILPPHAASLNRLHPDPDTMLSSAHLAPYPHPPHLLVMLALVLALLLERGKENEKQEDGRPESRKKRKKGKRKKKTWGLRTL